MTLWFRRDRGESQLRQKQFVDLCRKRGLRGVIKRDPDNENRNMVIVLGFKNKTEKVKLTAAWADMTCEVVTSKPSTQKRFAFDAQREFK